MAITQDRMIAILNAAQDYEQALQRAVALIRTHATQAHDGVISWQQAMENTVMLVTAGALLTRTVTTNKTLGAERQHFKEFARRNERAAQRAAQKRGPSRRPQRQSLGVHQDYLEFVPERTTAPREIMKEGRLYGSLLDDVDEQHRARLAPDPSLDEDEEYVPPMPGTLTEETRKAIDREAEEAVKSHPGTAEED